MAVWVFCKPVQFNYSFPYIQFGQSMPQAYVQTNVPYNNYYGRASAGQKVNLTDRLSVLDNKINNLCVDFNNISNSIGRVKTSLNEDTEQIYQELNFLRQAIIREMDLHFTRLSESYNMGINVLKQNAITSWDQQLKLTRTQIEALHRDMTVFDRCPIDANELRLHELEDKVAKVSVTVSVLNELFENQHNNRMQLTPKQESIIPKLSRTMKELTIAQDNSTERFLTETQFGIERKKFSKKLELDIQRQYETNELRGCTVLSSGELLFADHGKDRLLIITKDGQLQRIIQLEGNPFSVAALPKQMFAVTFSKMQCLQIFDLKNNILCRSLKFNTPCTGVSYSDKRLAVRIENFGFHIIDSSSLETTHKIEVDGKSISYVSINGDRIYYTNWKTGKVSCCDLIGKQLWELKNIILQSPNGITTDSHGNVFITGYSSNNILIISRDGLTAKLMDPSIVSVSMPVGIHYDKDSNELLVTTATGCALLYSVRDVL